jgi:hypothetical protein
MRFETATYAVTEDSTTATVKVTLDRAANTTVTVTYAASDGTATDGADYTATNGTLTFAPGEVSRSFDVAIQEDELDERDETVALRLSEAVNADLGTPQRATLTIVDDDEPPTVRFSSSTYSVTENLGTTVVTATLDAPSGRVIAVDYTTNDDTAVAGDDYTAISGTLTFVPGTTHRTFVVEIIDDAHPEPDKTIALRLSNASNAYLGTPNPADLVILDDDIPSVRFSQASYSQEEGDTAITIQVTLSDYSWQPVEVDYATADGTASAGSDYASAQGTLTFEPGEIGQTFTVDILEDALDEYDETLTLRLSNPLHAELGTPNPVDLTIVDDDPLPEVRFDASRYREREGTGLVTVVATLNAPSGRTVQVNYATEDGTAIAGQDYAGTNGTLTFTPGQTRQTFTVAVNDDAVDERDEETVTLRLSTPVNAALGDPNPITLTIVDNDQPPNVLFNAADYTIDEGDGTAIATVMLSAASGRSVTVNYLTEDGTAIAGQDYDAVSGQLTFDPGETSQTFAIPITDDDADEADETIALKLDNAVNASIGDPGQATLSILDDDVPIVQFSASSYNVGEGAGEATIAVTLDIPSWQAVTVDYATGDGTAMAGSDYAASSGSLTFNPGETNRTFNVAITDDAIDEPSETIALRLSNPVNLSLGTRDESTLTIGDNNDPSPTVQFSASSYPVDETINVATITATLSAASGWTVNVDYATSDGTARVGDGDYEATTGTLAFAPGQTQQTFEVIVLDDRLDEADETLNLALDTPSHATLGTPNQSTMVIVDDDPIPDLVGSFSLEPDKLTFAAGEPVTITVVITNQGSIAASPFWADFFINPSAPPERANTIWSDYCSLDPCLGISWYVATDLEPGQSIKLTSTYGSYADGYTVWPGYFVNGTTDLFLYVDSWNPGVPTGAVAESYEDNNRAELHGLEVTGASGAQSVSSLCVDPPPRPTHLTE